MIHKTATSLIAASLWFLVGLAHAQPTTARIVDDITGYADTKWESAPLSNLECVDDPHVLGHRVCVSPVPTEYLNIAAQGVRFEYFDGRLVAFAVAYPIQDKEAVQRAVEATYGLPNAKAGAQPMWAGSRVALSLDTSQQGLVLLMVGTLTHNQEMIDRLNESDSPLK